MKVNAIIQTTAELPADDIGYDMLQYPLEAISKARDSLHNTLIYDNLESLHSKEGKVKCPTCDFNKPIGIVTSTVLHDDSLEAEIELFDDSYYKLLKMYPLGVSSETLIKEAHEVDNKLIVDDYRYKSSVIADFNKVRDKNAVPLITNCLCEDVKILVDENKKAPSEDKEDVEKDIEMDEELLTNMGGQENTNNFMSKLKASIISEITPIISSQIQAGFSQLTDPVSNESQSNTVADSVNNPQEVVDPNKPNPSVDIKGMVEGIVSGLMSSYKTDIVSEVSNTVDEKLSKTIVNKTNTNVNNTVEDKSWWITSDDDLHSRINKLNKFYGDENG